MSEATANAPGGTGGAGGAGADGVLVFDGRADATARGAPLVEPPLARERVAALAVGEPLAAGVRLAVPGLVGLLVIRADPERVPLAGALAEALGLALPERLRGTSASGRRLRWLSPDEWLLSCDPAETVDVERRLREALGDAAHVALTEVSGGWCVLGLTGPDVRAVLARSTSLDVDDRAFPVGRVVNTVFAKASVTLGRLDEEGWELICRRSFADYVLRWLADASRAHGFALAEEG